MQPIGFFTTDASEAAQAYEDHVATKRRKPEGIEIAPAAPGPSIGANMRKVSALQRLDIAYLWRTIIRGADKKGGPVVSVLAPRERSTTGSAAKLTNAGAGAASIVETERTVECEFPQGTPAASLVQFSVVAIQTLSEGMGVTGEWQWTLRERGRVPE